MPAPQIVTFSAGATGSWRIDRIETIAGAPLPDATFLDVESSDVATMPATWRLRGSTGHVRYSTRREVATLQSRQDKLGRVEAICAALIPIRKSDAWWSLAQDERRNIFEEKSRHTTIGMDYLPAISRQLHHARELGEPFDFLTWFEFAPLHRVAFADMLGRLRATEEWTYVDREIVVWLTRPGIT